jgi:hypothetical protein
MPRPKKISTSEQSQSPLAMVMAPLQGYGDVMRDKYQYFLPCVEHCVDRIASKWAVQYPKNKYDVMASRFSKRLANHPQLKTFNVMDNKVLFALADEIEKEILSNIVMHNEEEISSHEKTF